MPAVIMTDMAKSADEVKKDTADYPAVASPSMLKTNKYPYGLCITLDCDSLKKLGLDGDMPDVGDLVEFCAVAKVTSASANETETVEGKTEISQRVEMQITGMKVMGMTDIDMAEEKSAARQKKWYKGSGDDEAAEGEAEAA